MAVIRQEVFFMTLSKVATKKSYFPQIIPHVKVDSSTVLS